MSLLDDLLASVGTQIAPRSEKNVLRHWGVKGMRWGVRKASTIAKSTSSPQPVQLRIEPGKRVKATGGQGHPPSDDAKAAAAYRQIARTSSSDALSNRQLNAVITRMKLDAEWNKIVLAEREKNKNFAQKFLTKFKNEELKRIEQGKTPQTIAIAKLLTAKMEGTGGKHRTKQ